LYSRGDVQASNPKRLFSVDVFRGIAIVGMILVNNQGDPHSAYYYLEHAGWNGWSLADLVFPFFLFIVGVVIPFSVSNRLARGEGRKQLYIHIIRRTIILSGLGLFINGFPFFSISDIRIPGVLQRVALCYFFSTFIVLNLRISKQAITTACLLILYWILMKLVPVPGYGAGVLTKEGNLAAYIDNLLMHGHMVDPIFDSEGLLSTIPAISTTLFGVLVGHLLKSSKSPFNKCGLLWFSGSIGIITGLIMDVWFPINKSIWSPSYAVFTAGIASVCFGVCYWLIEIKGYTRWGLPFVVYGVNAILVYVLSSLLERFTSVWTLTQVDGSAIKLKAFIFENLFASWATPANASFFYALIYVLIWLGFAVILYHKRIFIKI
jgi:predicted acyltransferase